MHGQAKAFTLFVKQILGEYFINKKVLDVGSGDINGNNRFLFENCEYDGNDVIQAPNVTIVSKTKDLPYENETFHTIVSTECFEHDPTYKESFLKIYDMLKKDGLYFFSCASTGRPEHGTRRTSPQDSYGTIGNIDDMSDYYKNLTEHDLNAVLNLNELFSVWDTYYSSDMKDLYFLGIKKGDKKFDPLPKYIKDCVIHTSKNIISNTTPSTPETSLSNIFDKYDTDKNSKFHNYSRQYEALLRDYRDKNLKYLEIGVLNGGSIKAMKETFLKSQYVVGVDSNPHCKKYEDVKNNIYIEIGNATNKRFIEVLTGKYGTFDIILDDGSHTNRDVIESFELLFPLLNDNGLYIIEDTICYKSANHIDKNYPNHLDYFYKYTKYLNQWRYDSNLGGIKDHCVDPFKIMKQTNNIFEYSIDKIEYGCSYIAISKKNRTNWKLVSPSAPHQPDVLSQSNEYCIFFVSY